MKQVDLNSHIVLISSKIHSNFTFGTGFVVYQDTTTTYALTAAHVIEGIGEVADILINDKDIKNIHSGKNLGLDLALLEVDGLLEKEPLLLELNAIEDSDCEIVGFRSIQKNKQYLLRSLEARLSKASLLFNSENRSIGVDTWDLIITDNNFGLERGYSGSPVIEKARGHVIGIVSHREGQGIGIAISINGLGFLYPNLLVAILLEQQKKLLSKIESMPSELLNNLAKFAGEIVQGEQKSKIAKEYINYSETLVEQTIEQLNLTKEQIREDLNKKHASQNMEVSKLTQYSKITFEGINDDINRFENNIVDTIKQRTNDFSSRLNSKFSKQLAIGYIFLLIGNEKRYQKFCEQITDEWESWLQRSLFPFLDQELLQLIHNIEINISELYKLLNEGIDNYTVS